MIGQVKAGECGEKLIEWKKTWKCMVATGEQERKVSRFQH